VAATLPAPLAALAGEAAGALEVEVVLGGGAAPRLPSSNAGGPGSGGRWVPDVAVVDGGWIGIGTRGSPSLAPSMYTMLQGREASERD